MTQHAFSGGFLLAWLPLAAALPLRADNLERSLSAAATTEKHSILLYCHFTGSPPQPKFATAIALAAALAGVPAPDAHFSLVIRGSDGWLKLTGNHPAGVQVGDLALSSNVDFTAPDSPAATGTGPTTAEIWNGASINVGEVYASLARDIVNGTYHTPGFGHAVHNSRLIARVEQAARTGHRQS